MQPPPTPHPANTMQFLAPIENWLAQLTTIFCSRFAPTVTKAGRVKEQIRENFEEKKPQKNSS